MVRSLIKALLPRLLVMKRLPPAAHPAVLLTFDDGPHPEVTPAVLDRLAAHGARAVFFPIGRRIKRAPHLLAEVRKRIESSGLTALSALQQVLQQYARAFAGIEHDYYRERMADVRDVIARIGSHLDSRTRPPCPPAATTRSCWSPTSCSPARR